MDGKSTHNLDSKNRLTIPKDYRLELGEKVVLMCSSEYNLLLYPHPFWVERLKRIDTDIEPEKRNALRALVADMSFITSPDAQGRILIPKEHILHAGIETSVVILGQINYCAIWAEQKYRAYIDSVKSEVFGDYKRLEF